MTKPEVVRQLAMIQAIPEWVETRAGRGDIRLEEVELIKSAIDDARIRIWGVLADELAGTRGLFVERFRIQRAIEICRDLSLELHGNLMDPSQQELRNLRRAARQLDAHLTLALR